MNDRRKEEKQISNPNIQFQSTKKATYWSDFGPIIVTKVYTNCDVGGALRPTYPYIGFDSSTQEDRVESMKKYASY